MPPQTYLHRFKPNAYHLNFDRLDALADRFLSEESDEPQIFYVWGHAYEMDYRPDYWVRLEDFFRRIAGHEDIFYGTNAEILL